MADFFGRVLRKHLKIFLSLLLLVVGLIIIVVIGVRARVTVVGEDAGKETIREGGGEKCKTNLWKLYPNHGYLFGTMHVEVRNLWDSIPNNVKRAFFKSDAAYFEIDPEDKEFWREYAECKYNGDKDFKVSQLPTDLKTRIDQFVRKVENNIKDLSFQNWENWNVDDLAYYLGDVPYKTVHQPDQTKDDMIELKDCLKRDCPRGLDEDNYLHDMQDFLDKALSKDEILDSYLQKAARLLNKTVGGCETPQVRCDMAKGEVEKMQERIEQILLDLENLDAPQLRSFANKGMNTYRCVNNRVDDDFTYDDIYGRNRIMTDRILELIQESPDTKLFVAFGAAHFRGNGSVVEMLREEGYQVKRVSALEEIE